MLPFVKITKERPGAKQSWLLILLSSTYQPQTLSGKKTEMADDKNGKEGY